MLLDKIYKFETSSHYKHGMGYESIFKQLDFNVYKYRDYKEETVINHQQQTSTQQSHDEEENYTISENLDDEDVSIENDSSTTVAVKKPTLLYVNNNDGDGQSMTSVEKRTSQFRIEASVIFETPHFDGIKLGTSAGQKGLAVVRKDVDEAFDAKKSIQLVVNNCSLVSRCAVGQLLQMNRNLPTLVKCRNSENKSATTTTTKHNIGICGYVPVFVMSNYITPSTAPMRLDQMHKCALIANSLPRCVNTKCCDNVANFEQLVLSTDSTYCRFV
jgi:hypothetical protein